MNETKNVRRVIAIVCQRPFDGQTGRQFCKLTPWFFQGGELVELDDFYNDHEIFWMLNAQTKPLAQPGRLLSVAIEESPEFDKDEEGSSRYRVIVDSPRLLLQRESMEIIKLSPNTVKHIENISDSGTQLTCPYPPGNIVLVDWKDHIYGLFKTKDIEEIPDMQAYNVKLRPFDPNANIFKTPANKFELLLKNHIRFGDFNISFEGKSRKSSIDSIDINYRVILPTGLDLLLESDNEEINIEPSDQALLRLSRNCVNRTKRGELRSLLIDIKSNETLAIDLPQLQRRLLEV